MGSSPAFPHASQCGPEWQAAGRLRAPARRRDAQQPPDGGNAASATSRIGLAKPRAPISARSLAGEINMRRDKRFGCRSIRGMADQRPADMPQLCAQRIAVRGIGEAILFGQHFGAACGELLARLGIGEFRAPCIGEVGLSGVGDHDQRAAQAAAGERRDALHDPVERVEKISDQHDFAGARIMEVSGRPLTFSA